MSDELSSGIGATPLWLKIGAGVFSFSLLFGGVAYLQYKKSHKAPSDDLVIENTALPDNYFASFKEAPETNSTAEVKKPAPVKEKIVYVQVPAPTPPPVYFKSEPVNKPDPKEKLRKALLRQRAAAGGQTKVLAQVNKKVEFVKPNYNPDYGLDKDIASQPLNLSRIVTADRLFPALLVNDIQSDLGGQIVAQAEENIYGFHGRNALIPAGSKFIGTYEPLSKIGMERMSIIWKRCITPEGVNINLTNAEVTDAMGRSGLGGTVDNRYLQKYGLAFFITTLSSIGTYGIQVDNAAQQVAVQNVAAENINLANHILEDQIDIKPRINIPAGTRININSTHDIYIPEPINGTTQAKEINL